MELEVTRSGRVRVEHTDTEGKVYSWFFCIRLGSLAEIEREGYSIEEMRPVATVSAADSVLRNSIDAGNPDDLSRLSRDDIIDAANTLVSATFSPTGNGEGV